MHPGCIGWIILRPDGIMEVYRRFGMNMKQKAAIEKTESEMTVTVPSRKNWFFLFFGMSWMVAWGFGLRMALVILFGSLSTGESVEIFMFFWLAGWICVGCGLLFVLVWGLLGREHLILSRSGCSLCKSILSARLCTRFRWEEIQSIEFHETPALLFSRRRRLNQWGLGPGKIRIVYGTGSCSFGLALNDAEARELSSGLSDFHRGIREN